jgi:hypothetical protein
VTARTLAVLAVGSATAAALLVACVGSSTVTTPNVDAGHDLAHDAASASTDGASVADASRPLLDLASSDLAGLFNCYGVAVCDPTTDFCIKYYTGSAATPGQLMNSPACFTPSDTCGNQGQNMDCACIQNDANLGVGCKGSCVDNMDGTFTCYAK